MITVIITIALISYQTNLTGAIQNLEIVDTNLLKILKGLHGIIVPTCYICFGFDFVCML